MNFRENIADIPDVVIPIRSEINFAIVRRFKEYGVEIPFSQRDIHMRMLISEPS
jgi:small-conductance mechanosensitive channel